ncbi:MAG: protein kinase [Acidobacteriota bacterium]
MDHADATLLVVDDNEENRDMLGRRLERRGYTVLTAPDGETALSMVEREEVDLILLDVMMPGIDGLEVLRRVRENHSAAELPVIMATARDQSEDVVAALDLGANDYVTKPIDFAVVSARVQKELRTRVVRQKKRDEQAQDSGGADLRPGSVLAGRYRLDEVVGKGNFGVVYRGHHLELDMPVAIKLLHAQVAGGDALQRFRSEGRSAVRIRHANAVTVYDFGVTEAGAAYLIMEFLEGEPLSANLRRERRLHPKRVAEILTPVCDVLEAAHKQDLVHRDVKPENVFLQRSGNGEIVKVLDFGIAKLVGEHVARENLTAEGFVLGTPAYMAPERLRNRLYDGRSDVYSLGVMLFQLLSGRLPFPPDKSDPMALLMMHIKEAPPKLRSVVDVSQDFEALIERCLSKEPEPRPTAVELAREFKALADRLPEVDSNAPTHLIRSVELEIESEAPTHAVRTEEESGWISKVLRRLRGQ